MTYGLGLIGPSYRDDAVERYYYPETLRVARERYMLDGKLHRTDGPAVSTFYPSGGVEEESFYERGLVHRIDGPALVQYAEDGTVADRYFYFENDELLDDGKSLAIRLLPRPDEETTERFSRTSYAVLLNEGITSREIIKALWDGVWTVEAIRALVNGAPAEWARAFEQGTLA